MMQNDQNYFIAEGTIKQIHKSFDELISRNKEEGDSFKKLLHKHYLLKSDFEDTNRTVDKKKKSQWAILTKFMDSDGNGRISKTEFLFWHVRECVRLASDMQLINSKTDYLNDFEPSCTLYKVAGTRAIVIPPKTRTHNQLHTRLGCDFADFIGYEWRVNGTKTHDGHGFINHMNTLVKGFNVALMDKIDQAYKTE